MDGFKKKKKGQTGFVALMLGVIIFVLALALIIPFNKVIEEDVMTSDKQIVERYSTYEFHEPTGNFWYDVSQNNYLGQSFTNGNTSIIFGAPNYKGNENFNLTSITLHGYKEGEINNVTIELYISDENGFPTGSILSTGTKNISTITTNTIGEDFIIQMSLYEILNSTKYVFIISIDEDETQGNLTIKMGTNNYLAGSMIYSQNSGISWTENVNRDLDFNIQGYKLVSYNKGLDCDNESISNQNKANCMQTDSMQFLWFYVLIGLAGVTIWRTVI